MRHAYLMLLCGCVSYAQEQTPVILEPVVIVGEAPKCPEGHVRVMDVCLTDAEHIEYEAALTPEAKDLIIQQAHLREVEQEVEEIDQKLLEIIEALDEQAES
jgi:hypothetical protein